jgi:hypothetical protein
VNKQRRTHPCQTTVLQYAVSVLRYQVDVLLDIQRLQAPIDM